MKANEFITERRGTNLKQGDMPHNVEKASPGSIKNNGHYDLYRASMAMAGMDKDGNSETEMDPSSWLAGEGYVGTYTDEEEKLAKNAFKSLGLKGTKATSGKGSAELPAVNTKSPVVAFKGYPR